MKTFNSVNFTSSTPTVVALGCFDGVHLGHTALISRAKEISTELSLPCIVWSFDAPPRNFFISNKIPLITTTAEKRILMQRLGVDFLVSVPFDKKLSEMLPEEFFSNVLIKRLKASHVVCGFNYRFGKGGVGDHKLLAELCEKHKIRLSVIPPVEKNGKTVSSSEIRAALSQGRIGEASILLGRPFFIREKVTNGKRLGRKLGFPTINQIIPAEKDLLKKGVYITRVCFNSKKRYGITNVGTRPTVAGNTLCAETNIFDFEGDLYGRTVTVEFLHFLREEREFPSVEALTSRVLQDIEYAKRFIN